MMRITRVSLLVIALCFVSLADSTAQDSISDGEGQPFNSVKNIDISSLTTTFASGTGIEAVGAGVGNVVADDVDQVGARRRCRRPPLWTTSCASTLASGPSEASLYFQTPRSRCNSSRRSRHLRRRHPRRSHPTWSLL